MNKRPNNRPFFLQFSLAFADGALEMNDVQRQTAETEVLKLSMMPDAFVVHIMGFPSSTAEAAQVRLQVDAVAQYLEKRGFRCPEGKRTLSKKEEEQEQTSIQITVV